MVRARNVESPGSRPGTRCTGRQRKRQHHCYHQDQGFQGGRTELTGEMPKTLNCQFHTFPSNSRAACRTCGPSTRVLLLTPSARKNISAAYGGKTIHKMLSRAKMRR